MCCQILLKTPVPSTVGSGMADSKGMEVFSVRSSMMVMVCVEVAEVVELVELPEVVVGVVIVDDSIIINSVVVPDRVVPF